MVLPKWTLNYFYKVAETVPAYKAFLKKNKIKSRSIKTLEDFNKIPYLDKDNYLRKYKFADLFPDRKIPPTISVSSGSSGKYFFWPRGADLEEEGADIHEIIFNDIFKIGNKRTLVIVCFAMGTWIAGTYTEACCKGVSNRGYNLSTITPGISNEDTIGILKEFAFNFDKVILAGYPPLLMDVITEAKNNNINLKKLNLNLLFAGENFSEKWREIIHTEAGVKDGIAGSVNIYGTADAAILGHETPLTVFLRKKAIKDKKLFKELFGDNKTLPGFLQYNPKYKFFQKDGDNLIFTAKAGVPLIRYNIKDVGELVEYKDIKTVIDNFKLSREFKKNKLDKWNNPFIILRNRDDISVTFYSLNIYPENIKASLESKAIRKFFTGKFTTSVSVIKKGKVQKLNIKLELNRNIKPSKSLEKRITKIVIKNLIELNSEYRKLNKSIGKLSYPNIDLLKFGDERFVLKKSKLKWVNK